jgi:N6-L-threonylcarbamoyladenine synthase
MAESEKKPRGVRILGIESSCDETAAAVVEDGRKILSSVVASQIDIHRKYGGVVPELASREHLRQIVPVVREAMTEAGLKFEQLDAIGVTQGPGLVGALLVGITYGKTLAAAMGKPLVAVNHLAGHVYAVFLEAFQKGASPSLPAVCLIVSGGHTVLYEVKVGESKSAGARAQSSGAVHTGAQAPSCERDSQRGGVGPFVFRKLGGTRDDAAGEAYDKVAKLLGLGYPGGPILDQLAAAAGDGAAPVKFGPTKTRGNPLDFSFSGLKTAVLYHLREHPEYAEGIRKREGALREGRRSFAELLSLCDVATLGLVREFQNAVVRDLVERAMAAAEQCKVHTVLVSGGVAANSQLRKTFEERARPLAMRVFFPDRALSTDNAAMIAAAAYAGLSGGKTADTRLNARATMPLEAEGGETTGD